MKDGGHISNILEKDCDNGEEPDKDILEKDHCEKVSFVAEDKSITTRCTRNCACCKSVASSKTS
jgi:hypothetical protein